jgi:hypothetical protein
MALNLLDSFGKRGVSYGLSTIVADVNDTTYLSKYFVVSEFNPKFTAGRNAFSLNGSTFLNAGSEIFVECLDSAGSNLFLEMATTTDSTARAFTYREGTSYIISIHVYNDTADGVGKIICYGTLIDNRTVKWQQNITIDKTLNNISKVRFYNKPILEVDSILVPVINSNIASTLKQSITFGGKAHTNAINPAIDVNFSSVNKRNIDIDYRLTVDIPPIIGNISDDRSGLNSQMLGATVNLNINKIKVPFSNNLIIPTQQTSSVIISDIVTNSTLKLVDPYFYADHNNNQIITNIIDADFSITYPYIGYNTVTSSYQTTNINGIIYIVQSSYADIIYRNIRTFTGFVARHKLYRKSLLSTGDFSIIADEPLFINEQLRDSLTLNKFYELLGKFYNDEHIAHYWFTSSNNLHMTHTPQVFIDSCIVSSPAPLNLNGNDYIIVKNDSINSDRNSIYTPFDQVQFNQTSGSSYDSNFIELKANVQYILQMDSVIIKDPTVTDARLEFYFTSSVPPAKNDPNFNNKHGIKLATLNADVVGNLNNFYEQIFFYTPTDDLFGTLVIVPYKCQSYLKNISFRVYGDDGFSPDLFITRIPWSIGVANETYQIKAELFDVNHNLIFSDLHAVQNFDSSGSSLIPFIPSAGGIIQAGTQDALISGSLFVSKSIDVQTGDILINNGNLYILSLPARQNFQISHSRLITRIDNTAPINELEYTPIIDVGADSNYTYVLTGSSITNDVYRGQSINSIIARRIYWNPSKQIDSI